MFARLGAKIVTHMHHSTKKRDEAQRAQLIFNCSPAAIATGGTAQQLLDPLCYPTFGVRHLQQPSSLGSLSLSATQLMTQTEGTWTRLALGLSPITPRADVLPQAHSLC